MNKLLSNVDFETKIVEMCWKLSELNYFETKHSKFYVPNLGDF